LAFGPQGKGTGKGKGEGRHKRKARAALLSLKEDHDKRSLGLQIVETKINIF
jgi:hypothetical protein